MVKGCDDVERAERAERDERVGRDDRAERVERDERGATNTLSGAELESSLPCRMCRMCTEESDQPLTRGELVKLLRGELATLGDALRAELRGEMAELRAELRGEVHSMQQQILDITGTVETMKARWGGGRRPDGRMAALENIHRGIVACAAHEGPWGEDNKKRQD